jgi:hypothetical protein
MTKPQHTPEPWRQEDIEQDGNILITDVQGVTIATCWKQPLDPAEWVQGNANLITAAPDLLATLKTVREDFVMLRDGRWDGSKAACDATISFIDATLEKAGAV